MSKRALLVGINQFIRSDWTLRGCVNDSLAMKAILGDRFDFASDQIRILNDDEATAEGIRTGLAWLLSDYSGGGKDVRLFHIATHGTQVANTDDDGEVDQLDEVIVPHDHSWTNPLRDDQLRQIFEHIPNDVSFTFVADCCHSGSVNKAVYLPEVQDVRERYIEPPQDMQAQINQAQIRRIQEEDAWLEPQLAEARGDLNFRQWLDVRAEIRAKLLARFRREKNGKIAGDKPQVLLAACRDEETAADALIQGTHRGAFTWSLLQAIGEREGAITYAELIERSAALLENYTQNPQLDCPADLRDRKFLSPLGSR